MGLLGQAGGSNSALITFFIYTLIVFGLAILSNQFQKGTSFLSEYFLGSRSLGMWTFALTFAATSASGGSFTGFPSLIYSHGWVLALWISSYMLVPALMMGLLGKRLNQMARQANAITIPDVLCARFQSRYLGTLSTVLIIFFMTFNLVAQFKSGALMLSTLLDDKPLFQTASNATLDVIRGLPFFSTIDPGYLLCLVFFSVAVIIYTSYGGFRAVVWTDVLQGVVMVIGVILLLPLVLSQVGGLRSATEDLNAMIPPRYRFVAIERAEAASTARPIPLGEWLEVPASGNTPRRVFRVAETCSIPSNEVAARLATDAPFANHIPVLEIRSPHEAERLTDTAVDLRVTGVFARARVGRTGTSTQTIDVPAGTIVSAAPEEGEQVSHRLLVNCSIPVGKNEAVFQQGDEVLRSIPCEETDLSAPAATDVQVSSIEGDYVFGAEQRGVYVAAPGPSMNDTAGFLPVGVAVSFFFFWTFSGAGQPSNMVRLMAFNSSLTLRRAMMTVAIYFSLIYFPLVIIFCCARVILPGMEIESDRIMPALAEHVTFAAGMPWLAGLLVAAPFAAVMSTVDSFLLMISSAIVRDVYQRDINPQASEATIRKLTYAATVLVGVAALLGALNPPEYLQNIIVFTGGGLSTTFFVPVALALYWPRFNAPGAIGAMLAGFLSHGLTYLAGWFVYGGFQPIKIAGFHPFLPELVISLIAGILITRVTAPPAETLVQQFFLRREG